MIDKTIPPICEKLREALRPFADPDGRIPLPIFDQNGNRIGVARRTPEEMTQAEAHVDDAGTAWVPPTAWAYMQACRARDEKAETIIALVRALEETAHWLEWCIHNHDAPDSSQEEAALTLAHTTLTSIMKDADHDTE